MSYHKKALILRFGAYGDAIWATALIDLIKEDGYELDYWSTQRGYEVIKLDPRINKIIKHVSDSIPRDEMKQKIADTAKQYDKFVNLSGSIEDKLLVADNDIRASWPKAKRHAVMNKNYMEQTFEIAGYGDRSPADYPSKLFFSPLEERMARDTRKKYKNKFMVLVSLSGSSNHKAYPFLAMTITKFVNEHPDAIFLLVGDKLCELLQVRHSQTKCYAGKWPIRRSLLMTKYADVVLGPETGVLNAAACYDHTHKIIYLSHSSEENLTKYWKNTTVIKPAVDCYPCHILHFDPYSCPLHKETKTPLCMAELPPVWIYEALEEAYENWNRKKYNPRRFKRSDDCEDKEEISYSNEGQVYENTPCRSYC